MDSVDGGRFARDEATVRDRFWNKIKAVARRVPFAEEAVSSYYATRDPATPTRVKAILVGALAYLVLPFDAVPDFIAGLGFVDDAAVVMAALKAVGSSITDVHRRRARRWLDSIDAG